MRGPAIANPPNPWASSEVEYLDEVPHSPLELYEDHSKEILSENKSPDMGFRWSVNPYRGCMHACAYCYARPYHEYLSFRAGTDFDTKIVIKREAADLLRRAFDRRSWRGERVMFSTVTDCYQPLEASLRLTRACLEVCAEYRNPVGIITKSVLIERDLDVLTRLAREASLSVTVSLPFLDAAHARAMEPLAPSPKRRLLAIERLAAAGIKVGVNVAPIIPGLNDEALAQVLEAAREAGACSAAYTLLRLPGSVKAVFESRLRALLPLRAERVLHRVRETRGGKLYDARFGVRMQGEGLYAEQIARLFDITARRVGLSDHQAPPEVPHTFRRPERPQAQLSLW